MGVDLALYSAARGFCPGALDLTFHQKAVFDLSRFSRATMLGENPETEKERLILVFEEEAM